MASMCPVCGYPWRSDTPPDFQICGSCGFQFRVTDDDRGICYEEWRNHWIARGMPWRGISTRPPEAWNPTEQIQSLVEQTLSVRGISLSDATMGALWVSAPPTMR